VSDNADRSARLAQALRAGLDGDADAVRELCTPDVAVWTPRFSAASLDDLLAILAGRGSAFSDLELTVYPLDVGGDLACVEWTVSMTHTGALHLDEATRLDPTGLRVTAIGVTVGEFDGDRICALRQYWDEATLLHQLGMGETYSTP
jgi:ketosteroid isomerase-like protein